MRATGAHVSTEDSIGVNAGGNGSDALDAKDAVYPVKQALSRSGGIGRRRGLKI